MSIWAKAILLAERAGAGASAHPWLALAVAVGVTRVLYAAGILGPVDWWGDMEVGR